MAITKWLLVISIAVTTLGCVQVVEHQPEYSNVNLAISSVWDSPSNIPKSSTYLIHPKYLKNPSYYASKQQDIYQVFANAIDNSMTQHGLINQQEQPDYVVTFAVALASDLSDDEISNKLGVTPGLKTHDGEKKASFMVYVENNRTKESVWRGTVQGIIYDGLDSNERELRINHVVNGVLSQFYKRN